MSSRHAVIQNISFFQRELGTGSDLRVCVSLQVNARLTAGNEPVIWNTLAAAKSEKGEGHRAWTTSGSMTVGVCNRHENPGSRGFLSGGVSRVSEAVGGRVTCSVDNSAGSASGRFGIGPKGNGPCRIRYQTFFSAHVAPTTVRACGASEP